MKRDELEKRSREELLEIAKKLDISGRTRMLKEELIRAIQNRLPFSPRKTSLAAPAKTKEALKSGKKSIRFTHSAIAAKGRTPLPASHPKVASKAGDKISLRLPPRPAAKAAHPATAAAPQQRQWHRDPYAERLPAVRQNGILPGKYQQTFLRLLVRDPHWLYACWEITSETLHQAEKKTGEKADTCPRVMRVYCLSEDKFTGRNHHTYFDVEIGWLADNWYIEVPHPDHGYCVEIGLRLRDGSFYSLVRSNTVRTPRDTISDTLDEEWATSEATFSQIFALSGGLRIGAGSLDFSKELRERLRQELSSGWFSSFRECKMQPHRPPEKAKQK